MRKIWFVAQYEYWRYVTRRGFIFLVIGMPLLMMAIVAVTFFIVSGQADDPVGVVDEIGLLIEPDTLGSQTLGTTFIAYDGPPAARKALINDEIQAYFVVGDKYRNTGLIELYHRGDPFEGVYGDIRNYVRLSLLTEAEIEPSLSALLADGAADFEYVSLGMEDSADNELSGFVFPFVIGILLMMAVFTTANYMLQAVVDEKENRTMEILVTSVSPERLMTGKLIGLIGVGLTQILVWTAFVLAGFLILRLRLPVLDTLTPSASLIGIAFAWFIPFYVLFAALMATIGISVTEVSEGQQASGLLSMLVAVPFYFLFVLISAPDSPVSIALSLFPFSAPLAILMRWPMTTIPFWQLAASWTILLVSAMLAIFVANRLLRRGMLRYGQRMSLRQLAGALFKGRHV